MMRLSNINMTTKVKKADLLHTLEQNLANHLDIVAEAKEGYLKKAAAELEHRLNRIRAGEVVNLNFSLKMPVDNSEVYINSIEMLKWNTEEVVELAADEFRQLVRDEWDWSENFYGSNSEYSVMAGNNKKWLK